LILDKGALKTRPMAMVLKKALAGGVDIVQWRDKISSTADAITEARALLKICRRRKIPFIINDRVDVALAVNPDGIHLGRNDFPVSAARTIFGYGVFIGLSCHNIAQIKAAPMEQLDYLGFGPVFPTKTKTAKKPLGALAYLQAKNATPLPVFAIGGINKKNIAKITGPGARASVCGGICLAKDITKAAKLLKKRIAALDAKGKK
jgi:thiamine-phosphate pyrophosphorylase